MHTNPYQTPTAIAEPSAVSDIESACTSIPHDDFVHYRRAALCSTLTMCIFFAMISVDMFWHMSIVDGMISLTIPTVMLIVAAKVMSWRTVADTTFTRAEYFDVSKKIRRHFLWAGPAILAAGVAQLIWVPERWNIFVWPCLVSGPLTFGCAFLWARVEEQR